MVILAKEFWEFELFRTFSYLMEFQFEFCRTFFLDKSKREKKAGKFKLRRHFLHFLCFGVFSFSKLQQSIKNWKKLHKVAMLKLKRINTTQ